jgi:ligand-binding sensor domain-containing protein
MVSHSLRFQACWKIKTGTCGVGTHGGGLARFDGREFKVYTTLDGLLNNQIIGTQMDHQDNLWILHLRG